MSATMTSQEQDIRLQMLNTFMSCPHRDTDKLKEVHKALRDKDPLFYAHLACWYMRQGDIRDNQEVFASMLITDPYLENREVGLGLFRKHAPFMKNRIRGFIKGKKVKIRSKTGQKTKRGGKMVDDVRIDEKSVGLHQNLPTSFKKEVETYLRWLEKDKERFDAVAFRNAKDLKALYAASGLQIKPSRRAQQVLFKRKYPEDSKLNVFKQIATAKTPKEAATLIVEHKVPYTSAVGLIEKMTPSVLVALINNMTPQQIITNAASLQEHGVYDNPDTKALVEKKLEQAKKSKGVSTLKSKVAVSTGRVKDESIQKKLDEVADAQVKRSGNISVSTAILVDRSGSMEEAIEVGKRCAALVSGATTADLFVVAFDNAPMVIEAKAKTYTAWENAFKPVRAGGSTSVGCALEYLLRKKHVVEQIVIITDEDENAEPRFTSVYDRYAKAFNVQPHVVIIHIKPKNYRDSTVLSMSLKAAKIEYDMYTPDGGDYYGLPGLVPLLARKSKLDLVNEIMDEPLIVREPLK